MTVQGSGLGVHASNEFFRGQTGRTDKRGDSDCQRR